MNNKLTNDPDAENTKISQRLERTAEQIHANAHFLDELEQTLRARHQPKRNWLIGSLKQLSPALGWVIVPLVVGLLLVSSIRSLATLPGGAQTATVSPTPETEPTATSVENRATPDPIREGDVWAWRGTTLSIGANLPDGPAEAEVYLWNQSQPVTLEEARALAERFGISAEPQVVPGELPGFSDYTVTDGVQNLHLRADHYFTYHSNAGELSLETLTEEQAQSITDTFLKRNGFDFDYKFERAPGIPGQTFYILPFVSGSYEIRFDHMLPTHHTITLDNTGANIVFSGYWLDYESQGTFGIISAEEAFFKLLDPRPQTGLMESFRGQGGGGGGASFLKLNLSGTPVPFPSPTATPDINRNNGNYIVQEGDTLGSIAQRFEVSIAELIKVNQLSENGIIHIGQTLIIPGRVEAVRGFISVEIHRSSNGSQKKEYRLMSSNPNGEYISYRLEGTQFAQLEPHNGLPITVTGLIQTIDNMPTIFVEDYTFPFPELQFQIVRGTQDRQAVNGQSGVIVFTTEDGRSFVEVMASSNMLTDEIVGGPGDLIQQEVLIVPDETFGDLPVIHIYQSRIVNASAGDLQIQANKIQEIQVSEQLPNVAGTIRPTATIEEIGLVFYVRYPPYALLDILAGTQYLQPAWRFYGHYSNGDEFEILIQALEQEFLLPELAPYTPPG